MKNFIFCAVYVQIYFNIEDLILITGKYSTKSNFEQERIVYFQWFIL